MAEPIFFDTETCGLTGPIVLLQYAIGDGEIILYEPWYNTIHTTIELFEMIANHLDGIVGFNLVFDWFHVYQMWTVLCILRDLGFGDDLLLDRAEEYAEIEPQARDYPYCLKSVKACDLMLHARKGPYQSTMDRSDIRIRRVPIQLAWQLAKKLDELIPLKDIYFARKKNKTKDHWQVFDIKGLDNEVNPDFKDVVLKWAPSSALKALAVDALGVSAEEILTFGDIEPKNFPTEFPFAPFAKAIGSRSDWKNTWPARISEHYYHWRNMAMARTYARNDVIYTRGLYQHFNSPELGDDDSELAICVACVRWKGYKVDLDGIKKLRGETYTRNYKLKPDGTRFEIPSTKAKQVKAYLFQAMTSEEQIISKLATGTKKVLLETIAKWTKECTCVVTTNHKDAKLTNEMTYEEMLAASVKKEPKLDCSICHGSGRIIHEAAIRAKEVNSARTGRKERELYDKLIIAGRMHASFKIIGTLSSRMSGADKLNPQGIKASSTVRSEFPLAWQGFILDGGDFAGFEVTIAEAIYNDPDLRKDLLTCEKCDHLMVIKDGDIYCPDCGSKDGKAIHALFGMNVFPTMSYKQIKATKGQPNDIYVRCKQAVFAMLYGGVAYTLMTRLGVVLEIAEEALKRFHHKYKGVAKAQKRIIEMFCSMTQPRGLGTNVIWRTPADYIESMFGFRRYFTLENKICKALFDLAQKPPPEWRSLKIKVLRQNREQLASGAVQSALFGAAFQLQAGNTRAASNHEIQSSGAQITKRVQRKIWDLQPAGIYKWLLVPMNIHDEVLCPTVPEIREKIKEVVFNTVESFRPKVPLIKMEWKQGLKSWAEKG